MALPTTHSVAVEHEIQGNLPLLGLFELLQICQLHKKNLLLQLECDDVKGRFWIGNGEILHAEYADVPPEEAIFTLLQWYDSQFSATVSKDHPDKSITMTNFDILMQSVDIAAEASAVTCEEDWSVTGSLSIMRLAEILQIFEMSKRTARITINRNGYSGKLFCKGGYVANADMSDVSGDEAVFEMLRWNEGRFTIEPFFKSVDKTVKNTIQGLVLEGMRRIDEEKLVDTVSTQQDDKTTHEILKELDSGNLSVTMRMHIAKRYLPEGKTASVEILLKLACDENEEVRIVARKTLKSLPDVLLKVICEDAQTPLEVLQFFAETFSQHPEIIEGIIKNSTTPDELIYAICQRASLKVIAALMKTDIDTVKKNSITKGLKENKQFMNFFISQTGHLTKKAPDKEDEKALFDEFAQRLFAPHKTSETSEEPDEKKRGEKSRTPKNVLAKISQLSVIDKLFLARKGTKNERLILMRNPIKMVALAALESPRTTDSEVLTISNSTTANEDVLKAIAENRNYARQYHIMKSLVFNPKTPHQQAMSLVKKMREYDLSEVAKDKNISEAVRNTARKLIDINRRRRGLR